jgi:hypothetical protein
MFAFSWYPTSHLPHQRRGSADCGDTGFTGAKGPGPIDRPREDARMTMSSLSFARLQTSDILIDLLPAHGKYLQPGWPFQRAMLCECEGTTVHP